MVSNDSDANVSGRLPPTNDEAKLLKPAITELLRTIPEVWATFDHDTLTAIRANALFLLTAAGMVERRGWIRATIANHPTCFELRFQATGDGGFAKAIEDATAIQYESWADAWRTWCAGETGNRSPFHADGISPQEWRLTDQGVLARGDLANEESSVSVLDFVLKRGFYGPGYWSRRQSSGRALTDDEMRTIACHLAAGDDLAQLPRPAVGGEGRLIELRKTERPTATQTVTMANWAEGADALADAFGKMLGPMFERLAAKADAGNGESGAAGNEVPAERAFTHRPWPGSKEWHNWGIGLDEHGNWHLFHFQRWGDANAVYRWVRHSHASVKIVSGTMVDVACRFMERGVLSVADDSETDRIKPTIARLRRVIKDAVTGEGHSPKGNPVQFNRATGSYQAIVKIGRAKRTDSRHYLFEIAY